jgi:hypothetical protein
MQAEVESARRQRLCCGQEEEERGCFPVFIRRGPVNTPTADAPLPFRGYTAANAPPPLLGCGE